MGARILKIDYYLPTQILDNFKLSQEFPEWDAEKIAEKVGIKRRHIAAKEETALDMAYEASKKIIKEFDKNSIDFIILCTQSPDYFLPTSACILQDKLKLPKNIGAIDINLGCSGYIYGLALSKGLINCKIARNVLLVTSETYSKHIHPKDKSNRSIFGDGAAATIITQSEREQIFEFELGTDGSGMHNLIVRKGGFREKSDLTEIDRFDESGNVFNDNNLYMNGPNIFNFTIENIPGLVESVLRKNGAVIDNIDYVIFHQANKFMLDYLRKKTKIPINKYYQNMEETGNTVSATIPIALKNAIDLNFIKSGDKILLVGFGVGYSWGATVIEL